MSMQGTSLASQLITVERLLEEANDRTYLQAKVIELCKEAMDWCIAEINRDSPAVINAKFALIAIDELTATNKLEKTE